MHPAVQIVKTSLAYFGLILVIFNLIVNPLDLVTTFIGFSRGISEQNNMASIFMRIVGNEYIGAVIIKAVLMIFFIIAYPAIKAAERKKGSLSNILSLALVDSVMAYLAFVVLITVEGNFIALGWF